MDLKLSNFEGKLLARMAIFRLFLKYLPSRNLQAYFEMASMTLYKRFPDTPIRLPLLESGTLGTKGNTQVIIPGANVIKLFPFGI
jgi:hypothetical protein